MSPLGVAVLVVVLATSAVACAQQTGSSSARGTAPAVTPTAAATSLSATDSPSPTLSGPGGCPVDASTLVTALKSSSSNIYARSGKPDTLEQVTCYQGYAVGQTPNNGVSQQSWILFGYNTSAGWQPLNLGSADYCTGYVSSDIAKHFPGCM